MTTHTRIPGPYPEHPDRHPGARPSDTTDQPSDREFTSTAVVPRPVVHRPTPAPARVITIEPAPRADRPFTSPQPLTRQPQANRSPRRSMIPWLSLTLMITAQAVLGAVTANGQLNPVIGAAALGSMTVAGLCLVVAELVHNAERRTGTGR